MADDDPRPTDPSVLEKGLMAADIGSRVADELRSLKQPPSQQLVPKEKPPATGQMFRGIGSLMRGRISPIVTAAQLFWNEIPESVKDDAGAMVDWLRENKMQDLVGLEKSGLEYFKQALMPTAQEPKGIMSLPYMLQSGEYASDTVEGRVPVYHGTPSPEITGGRFDVEGRSLVENPIGQGAAMKGSGQYSAQGLGVAEDYFDKEPRGRVLLNNKLLPKSFNIPIMTELTNKEVMDPKSARIATEVQRERVERFAKDFGVDVEDVNSIASILEWLEEEKEFYGNTDDHLDSLVEVTKKRILYNTENARENRRFLEGYSSMSDEEFAIIHGTSSLETMKDNIDYFRREAEDLERKIEDDTRLLEVVDKYNLKGTPGALVEFAYHPDDWKNMIDLDMKLSDQPEILKKVLQIPLIKKNMTYFTQGYLKFLNYPDGLEKLKEFTGQQLSETLLKQLKTSKVSERQAKIILAKEFADAGIPGNKYFDQQSRSAPEVDTSQITGIHFNGSTLDDYFKRVKLPAGLARQLNIKQETFGSVMALEKAIDDIRKEIDERVSSLIELDSEQSPLPENPLAIVLNDVERTLVSHHTIEPSLTTKDLYKLKEVKAALEEMIADGVKVEPTYAQDKRTKNAVVWDQKAMDRATKPVVLEGGLPPRSKADGGLVDKPLYDQPRMVG